MTEVKKDYKLFKIYVDIVRYENYLNYAAFHLL